MIAAADDVIAVAHGLIAVAADNVIAVAAGNVDFSENRNGILCMCK